MNIRFILLSVKRPTPSQPARLEIDLTYRLALQFPLEKLIFLCTFRVYRHQFFRLRTNQMENVLHLLQIKHITGKSY